MLDDHETARAQEAPSGLLDRPDRVEPVLTRPQGERRIVVAHLGLDPVVGGQRDVRRIGDHEVHRPVELAQSGGHVPQHQRHTGASEVALRPGMGIGVELDGIDLRLRYFVRDRCRDRTRARTQVDGYRTRPCRVTRPRIGAPSFADHRPQRVDRPAGHHLGLRSGDEHARSDLQLEVPERGAAGEMLQRHPIGPSRDEFAEPPCGPLGYVVQRRELATGDTEHMAQQGFGVVPR